MSAGKPKLEDDARLRAIRAARTARQVPLPSTGQRHANPGFDSFPSHKKRTMLRELSVAHGVGDPTFREFEARGGATSRIDGQDIVNFGSYDYLGFNADPRPAAAAIEAIERYGVSASASRLTAGQRPIHRSLEKKLARHYGVDDALTFVSGHGTNVAVISTVVGRNDVVFYDSYIHNSASVGATLSGASLRSFAHNDLSALEMMLSENRSRYRAALVIVEGHYSMDGDVPDLARLVELKRKYGFWLMVDEAHGLGCIGKTGKGVRELQGIPGTDIDIWMGTLSKTLGSTGGYVAGSHALIDIIKYEAPGSVYSVALAPALAAAADCSIDLLEAEPERVATLHQRGQLFLECARLHQLDTGHSVGSSIVPVMIGSTALAVAASQSLLERGINALPIGFPGVPMNAARLRFFLTSNHSEDQIRFAVAETAAVLEQLRSSPLAELFKTIESGEAWH